MAPAAHRTASEAMPDMPSETCHIGLSLRAPSSCQPYLFKVNNNTVTVLYASMRVKMIEKFSIKPSTEIEILICSDTEGFSATLVCSFSSVRYD